MDDQWFWARLESEASRWLEHSADDCDRRFWIDGFIPETITDTKRGVDVAGTVWIGEGPRTLQPYRFVVCIPQKMLHRSSRPFCVGQLSLDRERQSLQIEVSSGEQDAP